jgi:hypothetical protein
MSGYRVLALLLVAFTAQAQHGNQEFLVVGTVVWTNPASSSIAIRGTSLLGRLHLQVQSYRVKQPGTLAGLHPGDRITAEFSPRDGMLHRVRRVLRRNPA